ncbi:Z-ring formation inhibitor MciZ [Desertibacillus haloalkaliphilus]|nr:Z-ring formation inhibitor MciZ [Desertibacillus haloalkaliphilus]MBU8907858.1 Z-ring formation inhibitor MciZ [Desertibacillus haloalkaliphilus]
MKIYLRTNGVTIVGKSWEVCAILKQYKKKYETVREWTESN